MILQTAYDLLIYAWNARTGQVEAARVVRVVMQWRRENSSVRSS